MPKVEMTVARAEDRQVLENLMQLYVHDFSEHWAGTADGELGEDGRFGLFPLDSYWTEADRIPLLIRADGFLAGFALLNTYAHSGRPVDRSVAEFFVVRKYRREGVGQAAAQAIFKRYPGQWEAAVVRRNVGALAFWRRAASTCPGVSDVDEQDVADERWNGWILRFRVG
jgi:predicted acetyltransferase